MEKQKTEVIQMAAYLGHDLKCYAMGEHVEGTEYDDEPTPIVWILNGVVNGQYSLCELGKPQNKTCVPRFEVFPLMRPLSDLLMNLPEHLEIINEFSEHSWNNFKTAFIEFDYDGDKFDLVNYTIVKLLLKHHFDLFGMIDEKDAIDINTQKLNLLKFLGTVLGSDDAQ